MGGFEVVRAVPAAPVGPDFTRQPIRFEKGWFQGFSYLKFLGAVTGIALLAFFLSFLIFAGADPPVEVYLLFLLLMLPFVLFAVALVMRTRPATFEMDQSGARLYRGGNVVREIPFGPHVRVGVVMVGYWDDISPGVLRAAGIDENEFSLYDRRGFGPLFGIRFRGAGKKIMVSRKHGWDIRWIQWLWAPVMDQVAMHGMQMDRSVHRYMEKRRRLGLPAP